MKLKSLLNESLTLKGNVEIFHYTKEDHGDTFVLDPKKSVGNRSYYSNNDYNLSQFPRVFYYTDLSKTESQVTSSSKSLYSTKVPGANILMLQNAIDEYKKNKDSLKAKNKPAYDVVHALIGGGSMDWDMMFKKASKNFQGVYYDRGNLPIVNMFVPLEVKKYVGI